MESRWKKCKLKRRNEYKHNIVILEHTFDRFNDGKIEINKKIIRINSC